MKKQSPLHSDCPQTDTRSTVKPFCLSGVYFMEKPKFIKDLGIYIKAGTTKKTRYWLCECPVCGDEFIAASGQIKCGRTKSCGCLTNRKNPPHGMCGSRLYTIYCSMKTRCSNPNTIGWDRYGGRGISVCDEWRSDFMCFYNWAIRNGYSDDLELDRTNNDGNYEPNNCRWGTRSENCQNTNTTRGSSGYRGVFRHSESNKWVASIQDNGVRHYLGIFNTREEAAIAYNDYVIKNNTRHTLNIIK